MHLFSSLRNIFKPKQHATLTIQEKEWYKLHGHSRMFWFHMRDREKELYLRKMPLRQYARLRSAE